MKPPTSRKLVGLYDQTGRLKTGTLTRIPPSMTLPRTAMKRPQSSKKKDVTLSEEALAAALVCFLIPKKEITLMAHQATKSLSV